MARYIDVTDITKQIADFKKAVNSPNSDYLTGYICALSVTEGLIAETPTADVAPRADTVREFADRLKNYYTHLKGSTSASLAAYHIEQIAKEMIGE
jgi:hypothetical protein